MSRPKTNASHRLGDPKGFLQPVYRLRARHVNGHSKKRVNVPAQAASPRRDVLSWRRARLGHWHDRRLVEFVGG
jgi:hypothetical protein